MNSAILVPRGSTITIRSRRLSRIMVARSWLTSKSAAAMEFTGETDSLPGGREIRTLGSSRQEHQIMQAEQLLAAQGAG